MISTKDLNEISVLSCYLKEGIERKDMPDKVKKFIEQEIKKISKGKIDEQTKESVKEFLIEREIKKLKLIITNKMKGLYRNPSKTYKIQKK